MTKHTEPEGAGLSYPVSVAHVPTKGIPLKIEANEKERALLAQNHELQSVHSFSADILITQWKKDGIKVRGHIEAQITQTCIATLEPINAMVSEDLDTIFVPEHSRLARIRLDESGEMLIDAEGPDIPETFTGDVIDIWAVIEEFFELAIDPYPRKSDVDYIEIIADEDEEDEEIIKPDSPFAGLSKLRDKK